MEAKNIIIIAIVIVLLIGGIYIYKSIPSNMDLPNQEDQLTGTDTLLRTISVSDDEGLSNAIETIVDDHLSQEN